MRFSTDPDISTIAALIGHPARAAILFALLDGQMLPARELARLAGRSPTASSGHLGKLVEGGLLIVHQTGRERLYRMASSEIGDAMEALALVAKPVKSVALTQGMAVDRMRLARSCYDHLAGKLGVGVTEALLARKVIVPAGVRDFRVTPEGSAYLSSLDIEVAPLLTKKRFLARQCIDWTERRPHLAGALGAAVLDRFFANGWIARTRNSRAIRITPEGDHAVERHFGLRLQNPGPMGGG